MAASLKSATAGLGASNPLFSSKVTAILSTSYADSEFREALALLDERGMANTAEMRRRLRLDLQREVIESNGEIVDEFGKVADQLRRIGTILTKLNQAHADIRSQMTAAYAATSKLLEDASALMAQKQDLERKKTLFQALQSHFLLSEDEVATLTLAIEPVDDRFFAVLAKAKRIGRDCEVLLGLENQTLGSEVMEQTGKHVGLAFEKLYRWVQKEFRTLNLENPQIGGAIRRALRVLAERPTLFQNCLDAFAKAREQVLSQAFLTALTGEEGAEEGEMEGEDRTVKPIELAAHDALRYVGDMLAWAHSAAVGEREALEVLFVSEGDEIAKEIQAGRENALWRRVAEEGETTALFDAIVALKELADRDMSGAARVLRQRIEQVIQTNEDHILAYKLANLLKFYKATFSRLLTPTSMLVDTLNKLESEAFRQFRSLMRDHVATLQGDFQHTPADFGVPEFLQDALKQLTAVMSTYDTSLAATADREADFEPTLVDALDPFLAGVENMARSVGGPARSIFLVNCFHAVSAALQPFEFTAKRMAELAQRIGKEAVRLTDSQYFFFRCESGLDELITAVDADVDVEEQQLVIASQTLDNFLPSALMDAMENVRNLKDARLGRKVTEGAAARFCEDFERVEKWLVARDGVVGDEEGGMLRSLFPRTSGEIRVLLS